MPDGSSFVVTLGRRQKAALLVQFLVSEGIAPDLKSLPEETQTLITREVAALGTVDKATLNAVVTEFADEIEQLGLTGPGGVPAALASLSSALSPTVAQRLRDEITGSDPWQTVVGLDLSDIAPALTRESAEVAAILLSKLSVASSAQLLGMIDGDRARKIAYYMSLTAAVSQEVVDRIGAALAQDYGRRTPPAFAKAPPQRVGAILTATSAGVRDTLLAGLDSDDATFTKAVRKAIFTFADIPSRLAAPDVPKVLRGVEQLSLVTALAHALTEGGDLADAAAFLLGNMSQRMAEQLREEATARGAPRTSEGETAQAEVIASIRSLADNGDITLFSHDTDGA